jgi:glycosyltransferase involved in cell wall biosynthesis
MSEVAVSARSHDRRLQALILPPMPWQPERDAYRPQSAPDPFALDRHLAAHGIDTILIDPGRRPLNPLAGHGPVLGSLDPWRALRVLLSERRADIAVSVFEGAALPIALLRGLAAFRVPLVVWDLGLTESWKLRERILDRVVPRVDGIFLLSASQKHYVEARWGRRHDVEVLGHGVDATFFSPEPLPLAGPILAVGDDRGRDFATLLTACAALDATLLVRSSALPQGLTLPPNVTLMRDRISHLALRQLYAECRFVVVPLHQTLNASGVTTILEAGAMGRALIVSDNPAIRDFIVPDVTCLVVPCGDAAAMQHAIARLLHEPETCIRLGRQARRFVEEHCAQPVFNQRLASLLRRYSRKGKTDKTTSFDR